MFPLAAASPAANSLAANSCSLRIASKAEPRLVNNSNFLPLRIAFSISAIKLEFFTISACFAGTKSLTIKSETATRYLAFSSANAPVTLKNTNITTKSQKFFILSPSLFQPYGMRTASLSSILGTIPKRFPKHA